MAQKMVLVNPNTLVMKTSNVPDIAENNLFKVDEEMKRILDLPSVSDHDKAVMYEQALRHYLQGIRNISEKNNLPTPQQGDSEELKKIKFIESVKSLNVGGDEKLKNLEKRIIDYLPKKFRDKGLNLLHHLKELSDITWNELGEISVRGEKISGSNISDLLSDAVRPRKSSDVFKGWDKFAAELKRINTPYDLIGNKGRYRHALNGEKIELEESVAKSPNSVEQHRKRRRRLTDKSPTTNSKIPILWKKH